MHPCEDVGVAGTENNYDMARKRKSIGGRFNTVTSCISMTLVLLLLGTVVFCTLVAHDFSKKMKENFMVEVLLSDDIPNRDLIALQTELRKKPYARLVGYLSKEKGTKEMAEALQNGPVDFEGFNPIPAEFEIYLKADYANLDSLKRYEPELRKNPYVVDVVYPRDAMESAGYYLPLLGLVMVVIAVLLLVISFALINNTIRMSVYARRMTIHSMKLAGAKWGFIRRPFVLRAMGIGLIAAIIAGGLLGLGIWQLKVLDNVVSSLISPLTITITLSVVFCCGLLLTMCCSWLSVNRFLRMKGDEVMTK